MCKGDGNIETVYMYGRMDRTFKAEHFFYISVIRIYLKIKKVWEFECLQMDSFERKRPYCRQFGVTQPN